MTAVTTMELQSVSKVFAGGQSGRTGKDFVQAGYPAYGAGGVNGHLNSFEYDGEAVILSSIGARCGKVFYPEGKWSSLANTQLIFPDQSRVDRRFLWYQINDEARWHRSGTAQPYIKPSDIKTSRVYLPPLPEQRRIAAILDQADELRTKRRRALTLLDELADAVFVDIFGDPTAEKDRHPWMRVDEIATTRLGKMLDAKQQTGEHRRPYLRNANVHWMRFELDSMEEMDFPPDRRQEYRLTPGDILMCEGGRPGRSAIWTGEIAECYFQKALHRIRTRDDLMLAEVFVWTMKFMSDGGALDESVTSATIAHLTGEKLKALKLPVPSMSLQQDFVRNTRAVQEMQMTLRAGLVAADELFESLQHRAFRGEL